MFSKFFGGLVSEKYKFDLDAIETIEKKYPSVEHYFTSGYKRQVFFLKFVVAFFALLGFFFFLMWIYLFVEKIIL